MAQNQNEGQTRQVKGALFEAIVRSLLKKSNFLPIPPDGKQIRNDFYNVRGRACWHNIDACGKLSFTIPFVYPIRLLAEAKCYGKNVRLPTVQSFVGVVKDISENYFINDKMTAVELQKFKRYTDCGTIFSASDFSLRARQFAVAHGISLVSYANNPIIKNAVDSMDRLIPTIDVPLASEHKDAFSEYVDDKLDYPPKRVPWSKFVITEKRWSFFREFNGLIEALNGIKTSLIGVAVSEKEDIQYPIHLLSTQEFPEQKFAETDTLIFRPHYETISENDNGLVFRINIENNQEQRMERREVQLYFSLPKDVYEDYFKMGEMVRFKKAFMDSIEIPLKIKEMRRIIRLQIDKEWLDKLRTR